MHGADRGVGSIDGRSGIVCHQFDEQRCGPAGQGRIFRYHDFDIGRHDGVDGAAEGGEDQAAQP
jgi:hypothetical protein